MRRLMKALSLLVVLVFILSMAACTTATSAPSTATTSAPVETPAATVEASATPAANNDMMAPYSETVTVKMIGNTWDDLENQLVVIGETFEQNRWTKLIKEKLNIDIQYTFIAKDPLYSTKVNVLLASGDLPDIFGVNAGQYKQLLDNDMLADLTEIYDQYMGPTYKSVSDQDFSLIKANMIDGKVYAVGNSCSLPYSTTMVMWMRTDWLQKLNLFAPKNIDDLYVIAKAFKEADLDGVGITTPLGASPAWGHFLLFMNAYHAYPNIWVEKNGKLVYGTIQPEMMDALQKLAQWYQEGLIDPEYMTKDAARVQDEFASGKIGMIPYLDYLPLVITGFNTNHPDAILDAYPMVSADSKPFAPQSLLGVSASGGYVVRKGYEHPEALMKLTNLYTEILTTGTASISPDETTTNSVYYFAPSNASSLYLVAPVRYNLQEDVNLYRYLCGEALETGDTTVFAPEDKFIYDNMVAYKNGDQTQWGWWKSFCKDGGGAYAVKAYKDANQIVNNAYTGLPMEIMTEKMSLIDAKLAESINKIIMGAADISEFNNMLKNFQDMGGNEVAKAVNEWYQANKNN